MADQITAYARILAAKYGNDNPWIPHNAFTEAERIRFYRDVHTLASSARGRRPQLAGHRRALRAVNLPRLQPERRATLLEDCIRPLAEAGVDAAIHNGCDGWALPLDRERLRHGGVQCLERGGQEYLVDTSLWREAWPEEELQQIERRMAEMDWFPLAWLNYPKDLMEPQTPGFVGGHISHVEVWRWALSSGLDWVMVLEDDATPSRGFGLAWTDIWHVVDQQVAELVEAGVPWDILYVGHTPSYTREGREVTPLIVATGYCLRTHSYCLSRQGLRKLLSSQVASRVTHRPQDEVLASLALLAAGLQHPRADFDAVLREMAPSEPWLALAFKGDGLVSQLEDQEDSSRARSNTAAAGSARAAEGCRQARQQTHESRPLASEAVTWEIVD